MRIIPAWWHKKKPGFSAGLSQNQKEEKASSFCQKEKGERRSSFSSSLEASSESEARRRKRRRRASFSEISSRMADLQKPGFFYALKRHSVQIAEHRIMFRAPKSTAGISHSEKIPELIF